MSWAEYSERVPIFILERSRSKSKDRLEEGVDPKPGPGLYIELEWLEKVSL